MTSILSGVMSRLQKEIKQTKPFESLEEEVILNLARTNEYLGTRAAEVFKRADLKTSAGRGRPFVPRDDRKAHV